MNISAQFKDKEESLNSRNMYTSRIADQRDYTKERNSLWLSS